MIKSNLLNKIPGLEHGFALPSENIEGLNSGKQIHKAHWLWIEQSIPNNSKTWNVDAIGTNKPNFPIGVYSADCVPVLAVALDSENIPRAILAIHAGWRGTSQEICRRTLAAWIRINSVKFSIGKIVATIGPCIHKEAFEVGKEVIDSFAASIAGPETFWEAKPNDKFLLDLVAANKSQIEKATVGYALELDIIQECTFSNTSLPSYRRSAKNAGRILSYLALRT